MGVLGIYVHGLKDSAEMQSLKGNNPFDHFTVGSSRLSSIVRCYDPPFGVSTQIYNHIKINIGTWVEEAIEIRNLN